MPKSAALDKVCLAGVDFWKEDFVSAGDAFMVPRKSSPSEKSVESEELSEFASVSVLDVPSRLKRAF